MTDLMNTPPDPKTIAGAAADLNPNAHLRDVWDMSKLPIHDPDCALATTHHLTCTCGASTRAASDPPERITRTLAPVPADEAFDDPDAAPAKWTEEAAGAYLGQEMVVYEWDHPVRPGDKPRARRAGRVVATAILNDGQGLLLTGEFPPLPHP